MSSTNNQITYRQIDDILWNDWDPIGVNDYEEPSDEYYSYIPEVYKLKLQNATAEEIAQYLLKIETDNMGLNGNIERCPASG
ncbi:MAG TPA: hypothetical protein VD996_05715 [Chitinophagaceae bacterium]|nr:hypothetical protein [Chitinophagaceae bacterium]